MNFCEGGEVLQNERVAVDVGGLLNVVSSVAEDEREARYLRLPSLWLKGHILYCNGEALSLGYARRKRRLIETFLSAPFCKLNREEMLAGVFGDQLLETRSPQFTECMYANMSRTLCDTRSSLRKAFSAVAPGVEWLLCDRTEQKWKLVRYNDDYVLSQLKPRIGGDA